MFGVEHYDRFVEIQSETAIRHVATKYPYDNFKMKPALRYAEILKKSLKN